MKNCPFCKTENTDEAKFCQKCGHSFEITCPKCGTVNNGTAAFCVQCGTVLPQQKSNKNKVILIVICIVLAIAVVWLIIALTCKNTMEQPAPVIDKLCDTLEVKNDSTALEPQDEKELLNTMNDIDGNTYRTVKIGNQVWMAENLRVTKTNKGGNIPCANKLSNETPYKFFPDGKSKNVAQYGYLYNWSAAKQVCPSGWHLPSKSEYEELMAYCRMNWAVGNNRNNIGKALSSEKAPWSAGDGDWYDYDFTYTICGKKATNNASGFSAYPAGAYIQTDPDREDGYFYCLNWSAIYWTSTPSADIIYWEPEYIPLDDNEPVRSPVRKTGKSAYTFSLGGWKATAELDGMFRRNGYSVRCVRD